ncbi:MAG: hypothetical protein K2P51_03630, partial [Rhabdochlamydiaceae bacterium]|nr:hypothetical protein [Rhabdochlamydiaceae bacterium]
PALVVHPQAEAPALSYQMQHISPDPDSDQWQFVNTLDFSYDDVLTLLEEIEDDGLEDTFSSEELEKINEFLVFLAREGILHDDPSNRSILENDIQELLTSETTEYAYWFSTGDSNDLIVVSEYGKDIVLCKSWLKKKCAQVKKFVKKHKKEILIGVAVVVAVTIVVCAVSIATTAAAAAAGAATKDPSSSDSDQAENTSPNLTSSTESPLIQTALDEQISSFKELVAEDELLIAAEPMSDTSLGEKARFLGSFLAHETLDGISQFGAVFPQLAQEFIDASEAIQDVANQILPDFLVHQGTSIRQTTRDPLEHYQQVITSGHQKIDQVFSTDLSDYFKPSDTIPEDTLKNNTAIGILPPPGILNSVLTKNVPLGRIPASQTSSTIGWKLGDQINNRTIFGTVPKWSTVRRRYWKNQAYLHPENYKPKELERMKQGLAPQRINTKTGQAESKELHHDPAQRDGGLFDFIEVWPDEHALLDTQRYIGK